jgi:hypothetical protein
MTPEAGPRHYDLRAAEINGRKAHAVRRAVCCTPFEPVPPESPVERGPLARRARLPGPADTCHSKPNFRRQPVAGSSRVSIG